MASTGQKLGDVGIIMEIRQFENSDLKQCAEALRCVMNAPPWNENWTETGAEKYLEEFTGSTRFVGFIASDDNHFIGAAFCHEKSWWENDELYIDEFFIASEHQGSGYGSLLVKYIVDYAAKKKLGSITLMTKRDIPAYFFYLKHGFADLSHVSFMAKNI